MRFGMYELQYRPNSNHELYFSESFNQIWLWMFSFSQAFLEKKFDFTIHFKKFSIQIRVAA